MGELGAPFPISKQAVSRHVRVLEEAGLLVRRIEGRVHRCSLSTRPLSRAEEWIERQRRAWNWSLDKLEAHLEEIEWKTTP